MLFIPRKKFLHIGGQAAAMGFIIGLAERSKYLYDVENGIAYGSCEFFLGMPDWFALDKWIPFMFEVRNLCGVTPDMLFGLSMAESLIASSVGLALFVIAGMFFSVTRFDAK